MVIENKYFKLECENISYVPELVSYLETKMKEIMDFFELTTIRPRKIVIYNDLEEYKKHVEKYTTYHDYMCADTNDGNINLLSLEVAHQTKTHAKMTLAELKSTIAHEFVHICHQDSEQEYIEPEIVWFWEALATNLGNPDLFHLIKVKDEITDFASLPNNYLMAFTIGRYLLENYDHQTILKYVRFPSTLLSDSNRVLAEARAWSEEKVKKTLAF